MFKPVLRRGMLCIRYCQGLWIAFNFKNIPSYCEIDLLVPEWLYPRDDAFRADSALLNAYQLVIFQVSFYVV